MPSRRGRTGLLIAALAATLALPGGAFAASEEPVAGHRARIRGVSVQKASFGERLRQGDFLDLAFGDGSFAANAVSGEYVQSNHKLAFRIDPAQLRAFEASWRAAFLAHLQQDGLEPDSAACEVEEAKLKGRVRNGEVKLAASYRFRCRASGDFGEIEATARKRFRGRGPLVQIVSVELRAPLVPPVTGPGSAGGRIEIAPSPSLPETGLEIEASESSREQAMLLVVPRN